MWLQRIIGFIGIILCIKGIWHEDTGTGLGVLFIGIVLLCILFNKIAYTQDVTPYDIITGQYARAKSAWYCGK